MNRVGVAILVVLVGAALATLGVVLARTDRAARIRTQEALADQTAKNNLVSALADMKVCMTGADNFDPCTSKAATTIDQGLTWVGNVPAKVGVISIDYAKGPTVILSTLSTSGHYFCAAKDLSASGLGTTYGHRDAVGATTASGCGTASGW